MKPITIVMVQYDIWSYLFKNRKHFIAEFLAEQEWVREVIFCEPPVPSWCFSLEGEKQMAVLDPAFCGGWWHRLQQLSKAETVAEGRRLRISAKLSVFAPLGAGLPNFKTPLAGCYEQENRERLASALQSLLSPSEDFAPVLLWMHSPFAAEVLEAISYQWLVYDCTDDYTHFGWPDTSITEMIIRNDARLLEQADLVFTVSEQLFLDKTSVTANVVRLPNGCDYHHFLQASESGIRVPDAISELSGPFLGYFGRGSAYLKLDYPLLLFLATQHPEWQILLIGPSKPEEEELLLPNIHFLGHCPYSELPQYAAHFDVCILPHSINDLTRSMDPIKLYEYLATGKPVVSTSVSGAGELQPEVVVADSWIDFEVAVCQALSKEPEDNQERRLRRAESLSWDKRLEQLSELLYQLCYPETIVSQHPIL